MRPAHYSSEWIPELKTNTRDSVEKRTILKETSLIMFLKISFEETPFMYRKEHKINEFSFSIS